MSTLPYAMRGDGHAIEQENCLLSTKYGLCKRPGTTLVQCIEPGLPTDQVVTFPLYRDDQERIVVGMGATSWQVFSKDGKKYPVTHFPSSTDDSKTAVQVYKDKGAQFGPLTTTTTTLGDVTWINDSNVSPKMKDTVWDGYKETVQNRVVTNDDVWSLWCRNIVVTTGSFQRHTFAADFILKETGVAYSNSCDVSTIHSTATDGDAENRFQNAGTCQPTASWVAAAFAYQISNFTNSRRCEATNLTSHSFGTSTNSLDNDKQLNTVMGRFTRQDTYKLNSVSIAGSDSGDDSWGSLVWKKVDSLSDLSPNAWEDQTVKVGMADDETHGGFYMRFYSDDQEPIAYENNNGTRPGVTSTLKLPRKGHWEEYCGAGVKQEIDSATMPLLFVRRPDKSFTLMEARGEFTINDRYNPRVNFIDSEDKFRFIASAGFTNNEEHSPLVIGDTIEFRGEWHPNTSSNHTIELDTTYYIVNKEWDNGYWGGNWRYQISETEGGTAINLDDDNSSEGNNSFIHEDIDVVVTTYKGFGWTKREAGDEESNPVPGFIDGKINQIFNYQDRLGFLTEDQVYFSGTGDYFNVFRTTVRDIIESDSFSLAPVTEHGDILKYALAFNRAIILVSNKGQFAVSTDSGFGPSGAMIDKISQLTSDFYGMPVAVGDDLFLSYANERASGIYNLRPSRSVENKLEPIDTTANVPGYIPVSPRRMVGSEKHSIMFVLDDGSSVHSGEQQNLYVHTWKHTDSGLAHSAWTRWQFNEDNPKEDDYHILDMMVVGDRLYLIVNTDANICLEYIDLDLTSRDERLSQGIQEAVNNVLIDRKCHSTSSQGQDNKQDTQLTSDNFPISTPLYDIAYDGTNTIITPKFKINGNTKENVIIVLDDGTIYDTNTTGEGALSFSLAGQYVGSGKIGTTTGYLPKITVAGVDIRSARHFYLGMKYTMRSKFGPFIPVKGEENLGGRNIFVRGGALTYSGVHSTEVSVFQDKEYTQEISAVPSDWARNYIRDPANLQRDRIKYFGDYADVPNKWETAAIYFGEEIVYREIQDYTRAPDGTKTADYLEVVSPGGDDATTAEMNGNIHQSIHGLGTSAGQQYTYSVYIKKTATSGTSMQTSVMLVEGSTVRERVGFQIRTDIGTITDVTSTSAGTAYDIDDISITAVSDTWYRVTATIKDNAGTAEYFRVRLYPRPQSGDPYIVLWGSRLDKGATAATHYPQVPVKSGDTIFGLRKYMPDLEFEIKNTTPWNSMFQLLNYDLTIQENT